MTEFVAYGVPGSPFLRSVLMTLIEKSAPYRLEAIKPGDSKRESYLKLHPFGRIPAFKHGDFVIYETQAILRYLDAALPSPALQPKEPKAIARMNQFIGINDWYLFPQVLRVIAFQRIVGPALLGLKTDEAAVAAAVPDAHKCVRALEDLIGVGDFLVGDELTLADLMIAPQIDFLAMTPEGDSVLKGTKLLSWLGRMNERASMKTTFAAELFRKAA